MTKKKDRKKKKKQKFNTCYTPRISLTSCMATGSAVRTQVKTRLYHPSIYVIKFVTFTVF